MMLPEADRPEGPALSPASCGSEKDVAPNGNQGKKDPSCPSSLDVPGIHRRDGMKRSNLKSGIPMCKLCQHGLLRCRSLRVVQEFGILRDIP